MESVRAQSSPADEIIVVDDGSTDASGDLLWLKRDNSAPTVVPCRPWKVVWEALAADVAAHSDDRLIDHAQRFQVQIFRMSYALHQRGISRKNR